MKRLVSLLIVFAALSMQAQSIKMEFKPEKGVEYPVFLEINQTMTLIVPGMGNVVTQTDQIIGAVVTLAEEVEQGYLVEARVTQMTIKAQGQGQSQVFDSEGEDVLGQAIRSMMGQPLQMIISRRGEILEQMPVEDTIYSQADSILATQYARRRREQTMVQIKQMFSQNTIKSVVQAGLTKFPEREMIIPSVWTDEESSQELGAIVTVQQRLIEVTGNRAIITAKSVIMPDPNAKKPDTPQRMEGISGNGEATSVIDIQSGWVVESNGTQSLRGELVVEQGGQVQAIDLTMEVKTKITGK
ncbi:MAG TPA: DUF6263 family protein [Bacteroidales bacterium]|jgi:uncharacterized membrane protein|nr:hypothetical protein [Bacteroidales bacterium]OQC58289.1 MAG: hypothetical protein BWX52_00470 [Bacteroidetes bacterium ADurb.Bin013]MBV6456059.1 hypothetical protein [Bacteroidales bacterium]MCZ2315882.1 DUF6263 family protein [Bacteroidales bacterium]NLZ09174.1 hypothetical protein [Bacteroidales bacterium]